LDEHNKRATKGNGQEKADSGIQNVHAVPSGAASGSNGDPWIAALRVMLDPANLCQALEPARVEELQLASLPMVDKATVNRLQELFESDTRRRNPRKRDHPT